MNEHENEEPKSTTSAEKTRRFRWLTDPSRRRLLLPISGAWILALDWLLFSSNAASLGLATPLVAAIGFVLGAIGTSYFQRRFAGDNLLKVALKALFAGIVVGVPWPLFGTLVGGWILVLSGLGNARDELLRK